MKRGYIAIEGPIGVGKTSLAKMLAERLNGQLFLEKVEDNPFLKKFYEEKDKNAFQTQLFFLLSRYKSQAELMQPDLFQQVTVADYLFDKDRIFAAINLNDDELALYEQIYALLDRRVVRPDLVIYLQAGPRLLAERIRRRGKLYERGIELKYLQQLCEAYNNYFFYYNAASLLVVNTENIDFVKNPADFEDLLKELKSFRQGVQYFNPLGSR